MSEPAEASLAAAAQEMYRLLKELVDPKTWGIHTQEMKRQARHLIERIEGK